MAATKYQILYRYINEATNTPITNSTDNKYELVREFYTDPDHKIFFDNDPVAQAEATNEQQELISFGNSGDNPKNNMLFAYDGTKKIRHPKWVPAETGYIVRDWKRLKRNIIGNQGDFTKEFTTIDALTPEDGGTVVCTKKIFDKYFPNTIVATDIGGNYTSEQIKEMITESTMFAVNLDLPLKDFMTPSERGTTYMHYSNSYYTYYTGPIVIDRELENITLYKQWSSVSYGTVKGSTDDTNLCSQIIVKPTQVQTTTMPGHYEESLEPPYLIVDTYKRIQLSPWFVNCTCASLESAVSKARTLVEMLGIENVKLIKLVPFDQFIKIK